MSETQKKNKIITKNAKTTELYIIKTIRSVSQQNLKIMENASSTNSNTISEKSPFGWKIVMRKKWVRIDNSFKCFDVVKVTTIQMNSIQFDFEKKFQNSAKKSMNRLKILIQNSQTMFLNTQSKNFNFQ